MTSQHFFNQFQPDGIKLMLSCPVCSKNYNLLEAKVIEEKESLHLLHIQCRSCQSSVVSVVYSDGLGISSMGLVSDLTAEDVLEFKGSKGICIDDVMEMHRFLEQGGRAAG